MILLGYRNKSDDDVLIGGTSSPPSGGPNGDLIHMDEDLAKEQLKCMQAYLLQVNTLFAWSLLGYLPLVKKMRLQAEQFARSESNSLRILKKSKDEYRLVVDMKAARRKRKTKPSWIFERMDDLAKSKVPVEVWDTGGVHIEVAQTGNTYENHSWHEGKGPPEVNAKPTRTWIMNRRTYSNHPHDRALKIRGSNYIHELVIHAWRDKVFGYTPSPSDRPKNMWGNQEYFIRQSFHNHPGHIGPTIDQLHHNLADIEGDFLSFYLFFGQDWVDAHFDDGEHDPREAVATFNRNMVRSGMKPLLDLRGENWFSYAGMTKRMAEARSMRHRYSKNKEK